MASLANDPGGTRRILVMVDGKRKPIRLGKIPKKQAEAILRHIEALSASRIDGSTPPGQTCQWLAGVSVTLRERLVRVGLADPMTGTNKTTLADEISGFLAAKAWRSNSTRKLYDKAFAKMILHFGATIPLAEISEGHADDFRNWLLLPKPIGGGLAESTANKTCSISWTLFRRSVRFRQIDRNPFDEVPRGGIVGEKRFISTEDSRLVMEHLPHQQMRLLFALARWGGLRVPSEPRLLRWGDVDFDQRRLTVHSPKTQHHKGHEHRLLPIFPELAELLDQRFEDAAEGEEFVLPFMRRWSDSTFASLLGRAIDSAGLERWPRMWHSLRSTRQIELEDSYPSHVVCTWIGNSESVAKRHYLNPTDEHFQKAAQNPAQLAPAAGRTESHTENSQVTEPLSVQGVATSRG